MGIRQVVDERIIRHGQDLADLLPVAAEDPEQVVAHARAFGHPVEEPCRPVLPVDIIPGVLDPAAPVLSAPGGLVENPSLREDEAGPLGRRSVEVRCVRMEPVVLVQCPPVPVAELLLPVAADDGYLGGGISSASVRVDYYPVGSPFPGVVFRFS